MLSQSVGVLIDRGFGLGVLKGPMNRDHLKRVCVVFLGGPDSRNALKFGCRMADHPAVRLTVTKFVTNAGSDGSIKTQSNTPEVSLELDNNNNSICAMSYRKQMEQDEALLEEFTSSSYGTVVYIEKEGKNNC